MRQEISLAPGIKLCAGHAVYFRDDNALAIADLHLGYEAALQAEHVAIPRFQLEPMLGRLSRLLDRFKPELLVINGDLKHEFSRNKRQEWDEVDAVMELCGGMEVVVVRGNHDNYLQSILAPIGVKMADSFELAGGSIVLHHGHRRIPPGTGFRVFAHEHPVIRVKDEVGARMILPCFLHHSREGFLVMPAFSPMASGTDVISQGARFMNPALQDTDMSDARVFGIHGGIMDFGKVGDLRNLGGESYIGTES